PRPPAAPLPRARPRPRAREGDRRADGGAAPGDDPRGEERQVRAGRGAARRGPLARRHRAHLPGGPRREGVAAFAVAEPEHPALDALRARRAGEAAAYADVL